MSVFVYTIVTLITARPNGKKNRATFSDDQNNNNNNDRLTAFDPGQPG